jgi:methionyl aminopeptidase
MRIVQDKSSISDFIILQDNVWLERQRIAGKVVAGALQLLENAVKEKTTMTMLELNNMAGEYIERHGCQQTFRGYKGFPYGVCISINKQLVHGVPSDYRLKEGDVVSFDLGATYNKAIADSAITVIYGEPKSQQHIDLIKNTEQALYAGIDAIKIGKRLGCIGNAISKYAKNKGHGCITKYGGHSLNWDTPHAQPFVPNKANENEGVRLQENLTLAVEPMLTSGSTKTWTDKDGWTVWCEADMSAHFEHTVYLHEDKIEVITDRK